MSRRNDYLEAYDDMLERTDSDAAPWEVIATDSKRRARLEGIEVVANALGKGANLAPPDLDPEVAKAAQEMFGWDPSTPARARGKNNRKE